MNASQPSGRGGDLEIDDDESMRLRKADGDVELSELLVGDGERFELVRGTAGLMEKDLFIPDLDRSASIASSLAARAACAALRSESLCDAMRRHASTALLADDAAFATCLAIRVLDKSDSALAFVASAADSAA